MKKRPFFFLVILGTIFFSFNVLMAQTRVVPSYSIIDVASYEINMSKENIGDSYKDSLYSAGILLLSEDKYAEAFNVFKSMISNVESSLSDAFYNNYAFVGMMHLCALAKRVDSRLSNEVFEYIKAHTKDDENASIDRKRIYVWTLRTLGYDYEAISYCEEILRTASFTTANEEIKILQEIISACNYIMQWWTKDPEKETEELKLKVKESELKIKLINDGILINNGGSAKPVIYFGEVNIGQWKRDSVRVTNSGTRPYVIPQVFIIPQISTMGDGFTLISPITMPPGENEDIVVQISPITIQPGESENIVVQFSPTTKSNYTADLVIRPYLDAYNNSVIVIATLLGNATGVINNTSTIDKPADLPTEYSLSQNYPNPFNPTTTIQYSIPKDEYVKLAVYDVTGKIVKELANGYKSAGRYNVEFNASGYASGIYYYKIEAGVYNNTQKMMLVK
jgi:hypothetical protein